MIICTSALSLKNVGVIIYPNKPFYALYGIIFEVICSVLCDKNKLAIMGISFNIILYSVCSIIRSCSRNS